MDAAALPAPWREFARQAGPYVRDRGALARRGYARDERGLCVSITTYGSKPLTRPQRLKSRNGRPFKLTLCMRTLTTSREAPQMGKDQGALASLPRTLN